MGAVRPNIDFSIVEPKLDSDRDDLVDPVDFEIPDIPIPQVSEKEDTGENVEGDVWKEFSINLGIGDMLSEEALESFNNFLKKVDEIIKKLNIILKILRLFSSDLLNITRALKFAIRQIVETLRDIVNAFMSTGIYTCLIRPDESEKDNTYIIPTWGSFEEMKSKVAAACLDRENPKSPARLNMGNIVGGFVIGGLAGTNDPSIIDHMISNMQLLSELFGITGSYPSPPKSISAQTGYYNKRLDFSLEKKLGVKISWYRPDSKGVVGYRVFRCRVKDGLSFTEEQRNEMLLKHPLVRSIDDIRNFDEARIYRDDDFEPQFVLGGISRDRYKFIDFDVEEGEIYFYTVMSVIKADGLVDSDPWNRRLNSPLMSQPVGIRATYCIPTSEIEKEILSIDGDFISAKENYRYDWKYLTIRKYLGPPIEKLLDRVDQFAEQMAGVIQTSSDAMNDYINFMAGKIRTYTRIIQIMLDIVTTLVSFRLRGSLLLLTLEPETGGIENYASRVRDSGLASYDLTTAEAYDAFGEEALNLGRSVIKEERNKQQPQTGEAGKLASIRGIYFAYVTVYGWPDNPNNQETIDGYVAPYREEYNAVQKRLERNQRAVNMLLKLLIGD